MEGFTNTDYIQAAMQLGLMGICWGFAISTVLKFISYGIFKAIYLLNMAKY